MLPVVALTGRPNVGKSTLFNRFAGKREALVADFPGLTRDRRHCLASLAGRRVILVDTPGVGEGGEWDDASRGQFERALAESDLAVLLTDARQGLCPADETAAAWMREAGAAVILAVNKSEGQPREISVAEFHALGIADPHAISALRGDGVAALADAVACALPVSAATLDADQGRTGDRDCRAPERGQVDAGEPVPGRGAHAGAGPGRNHARQRAAGLRVRR